MEAEDRISKLPDSILHHILSFLDDDIKCVFSTSLLSKRWKYIWSSIPTLVFPDFVGPPSLFEVDKFMQFVDRTLFLHDTSSSIRKFHLMTGAHMCVSRVHSWIEHLTRCNVEDVNIYFAQHTPFYVPLSLFTCQSLIKLEIVEYDGSAVRLPKSFTFPKLKTLRLIGIQFTSDDCSWKAQQLSDCPVLEELVLEECTWLGTRNFCISSPALKFLVFDSIGAADGLRDCALAINAPNLVSLTYSACVAKEYVISSFQSLKSAEVWLFCRDGEPENQHIGYGAAVSKFVQKISCVQSLQIHPDTLKALSMVYGFVNILPTFHDLGQLTLGKGETTDTSLFSLLKAVPNLKRLVFEESCIDDNEEKNCNWESHLLTAGCMFQQLESVTICRFREHARQLRWVHLILKNAKALESVILRLRSDDGINVKVLALKLQSLSKASHICKFKLVNRSL